MTSSVRFLTLTVSMFISPPFEHSGLFPPLVSSILVSFFLTTTASFDSTLEPRVFSAVDFPDAVTLYTCSCVVEGVKPVTCILFPLIVPLGINRLVSF